MFTGIIEAVGSVVSLQSKGSDSTLTIDSGNLDLSDVKLGDSIAINGVCLTVTSLTGRQFTADVSAETLRNTILGNVKSGSRVNLEKALTLATRLGGHLVSGHVDGVGTILSRTTEGRSERYLVSAPAELMRYIAAKGAICVNGISLTVTAVSAEGFSLNIIPHTAAGTTMEQLRVGDQVNLEIDLIARYLERLIEMQQHSDSSGGIKLETLAQYGFLR